jgi:putative flippase GtrA
MKLAITYAILALLATAANMGAQEGAIRLYTGDGAIMVSVGLGTGVGLVVKYILDKRFIFRFRAKNASHDRHLFVLYTLTGVATTAIFWGLEFGFHHFFQRKDMRYLGGILGLAIGYFVKYRLDKRYVFRSTATSVHP